MGRSGDEQVEKVLKLALRGQPLRAAWEKCGEPGTWGNVGRRFNLLKRQADDASAAAEATPANKRPKKAPNGASLAKRGRGNEAALQSGGSGSAQRTGSSDSSAKRVRRPSRMVDAEAEQKERYWQAWKAAHKAATKEYGANVAAGTNRRKGRDSNDCLRLPVDHQRSNEIFWRSWEIF